MNLNLVEYAIHESKILTIKTASYLSRERNYIDRILKLYLQEIEKPFLVNQVAYCLHELAGNANRANAKRIYFQEKGLNIHNPEEYEIGLETFRSEAFDKIEVFQIKQKNAGLYIKIDFHLQQETLRIRVRNNSLLTLQEQKKIESKFHSMREYKTIPEAYKVIEDSTEGAGLGLVMILQLLYSIGFGSEALKITTEESETIATLFLHTSSLSNLDIA